MRSFQWKGKFWLFWKGSVKRQNFGQNSAKICPCSQYLPISIALVGKSFKKPYFKITAKEDERIVPDDEIEMGEEEDIDVESDDDDIDTKAEPDDQDSDDPNEMR